MISIHSLTGHGVSNNLIGSLSRNNEQDLKSKGSTGLAKHSVELSIITRSPIKSGSALHGR